MKLREIKQPTEQILGWTIWNCWLWTIFDLWNTLWCGSTWYHIIAQWLLQAKSPNSWSVYFEVLTFGNISHQCTWWSAYFGYSSVLALEIQNYASVFQIVKDLSPMYKCLYVLWKKKMGYSFDVKSVWEMLV